MILAHSYIAWWIAQLIAIAILIFLALRWRPGFLGRRTIGQTLGGALDTREAAIREQLQAAERSREEAERIRQESAKDIADAQRQAQEIVSRAAETSQAIRQEMQDRAQEEYRRIVSQARTEIDYERERAELALRRRAADIVIDAAGQVVRQNLDAAGDRRIIEGSLDDLGRLA